MKRLYQIVTCLLILASISSYCNAMQTAYTDSIRTLLDSLSKDVPALKEKVNITVSNESIQEFLRGVSKNSGLNINVDPKLNLTVTNNFSDVEVKDILTFICYQYNLEFQIIGNIITVYQKEKKKVEKVDISRVVYDVEKDQLTIDYQNVDINECIKEIIKISGKNIIPSPGIGAKKVSGYIEKMPFSGALEKFCYANNLELKQTDDGVFIISSKPQTAKAQTSTRDSRRTSRSTSTMSTKDKSEESGADINVVAYDSINIAATEFPMLDLIRDVSDQLNINYYISTELKNNVTLNLVGVTYDEFLSLLFSGSDYTFKIEGDIYIIGENKTQVLQEYRVVQFQNRTIDKIVDYFPGDLTTDIDIKEFPDLNSLLLGGPPYRLDLIEAFVRQIDKVVPVILIEVIIVDVKKSSIISTGVSAGLREEDIPTTGTLFPEIDVTLSSKSINEILERFDHFGFIKLGKVTPQFYASLRLLETEGLLNVRSTPKLATLNGYEASLSIGNTEYYLEEKSQLMGSQIPQSVKTTTYVPIDAQLAVNITPVVSGDEQITLEIDVQQSDFTERISEFAPPGKVNRNFNATIRVKNQEMVLLGGLEEKRNTQSGSGVPILSKLPILKWIFSSRLKDTSKSQLNIFIKPTIY